MSVGIKINQEVCKQWELWESEKFGGIPIEAVLSCPSSNSDEAEEKDKLFLIIDFLVNKTSEEKPYFLVIDGQIQSDEDLVYVGEGEEPDIDYYREEEEGQYYPSVKKDFVITKENVSNYLEKQQIKEELKGKELLLSEIICGFLNRDLVRMDEVLNLITWEDYGEDSNIVKKWLNMSIRDRASTIAQIEALSEIGVIPPFKEENAIAGQESSIESKTKSQSFVIPEDTLKLFEYFIEKSKELIRTEEGYLIVNLDRTTLQGFYTHVCKRNKAYSVPKREQIIEYVRKPDGSKYSIHSLKKEEDE